MGEREEACHLRTDGHCLTHRDTIKALGALDKNMTDISNDLKWYNKIGGGIFAVGLLLLGSGLYTLIYFGKLDNRVQTLEKEMTWVIDHIQDASHFNGYSEGLPPTLGPKKKTRAYQQEPDEG